MGATCLPRYLLPCVVGYAIVQGSRGNLVVNDVRDVADAVRLELGSLPASVRVPELLARYRVKPTPGNQQCVGGWLRSLGYVKRVRREAGRSVKLWVRE